MSTFDTIIGLANLGTQIAALTRLEEIRRQGMSAAEYQAYQNNIKNEIFKFKDAAKTILESEKEKPKLSGGMMKLLDASLQKSGLSTDVFSEIPDKAYTADTIRYIKNNASRLYDLLPPNEQAQVDQLVLKTKNLPEYEYYLDNHDVVKQYRKLKKQAGAANRVATPLGMLMSWVLVGLGVIMCGMSSLTGGANGFGLGLLCLVVLGGIGYLGVLYAKKQQQDFTLVDRVEREIDLNWFNSLEQQYSRLTLNEVQRLRDEAEQELSSFLGEERPSLSVGS